MSCRVVPNNIEKMNYNNTSENVECPICMECILDTKNKVTTECGHCFHTNCLMTSVAHNGFGCPYCRTAMAEEIKDDDDEDEDDWGSVDSDEEDNDRALRGFRFMFNGLSGEPNDPEDNLEEDEDDEEEAAADDEDDVDKPSPDYITQKLVEQGVTMSQLVKVMLSAHEEYANEESFDRIDDELYGKLRIIISNYQPETAVIQDVVAEPAADFDAQPKISNSTIRRMMGRL